MNYKSVNPSSQLFHRILSPFLTLPSAFPPPATCASSSRYTRGQCNAAPRVTAGVARGLTEMIDQTCHSAPTHTQTQTTSLSTLCACAPKHGAVGGQAYLTSLSLLGRWHFQEGLRGAEVLAKHAFWPCALRMPIDCSFIAFFLSVGRNPP